MSEPDSAAAVLRTLEEQLVDMALHRAPMDDVVEQVARMMCEAGVRVDEIRVAARTLHPAIDAVGVSWSTVAGVETGVFRPSANASEAWLRSPLPPMLHTDTTRLPRAHTDPAHPPT